MKKVTYYAACLLAGMALFACQNGPKEEPIGEVIERGLNRATEQSLLMAKTLEAKEGQLPTSIKNDTLTTSDYSWWCSGFFPGVLWYLYENNPSEELKQYAEMYTARVEPAKTITYSHDLGFMLNCSFGNGYCFVYV